MGRRGETVQVWSFGSGIEMKNLEKIIQVDSYIVVELGKELWNCLRRAYPKEIILVWNTLGSNYPRKAYPRRLYWFETRLVPIIPGRLIPGDYIDLKAIHRSQQYIDENSRTYI